MEEFTEHKIGKLTVRLANDLTEEQRTQIKGGLANQYKIIKNLLGEPLQKSQIIFHDSKTIQNADPSAIGRPTSAEGSKQKLEFAPYTDYSNIRTRSGISHELIHVLWQHPNTPSWFKEGFADVLSQHLVDQHGFEPHYQRSISEIPEMTPEEMKKIEEKCSKTPLSEVIKKHKLARANNKKTNYREIAKYFWLNALFVNHLHQKLGGEIQSIEKLNELQRIDNKKEFNEKLKELTGIQVKEDAYRKWLATQRNSIA